MTIAQKNAINELREAGYAVVVMSPEELGTATPKRVESRTVELMTEVIEELND